MISTKYIDRYIEKMRKIQDEILKAINTEEDSAPEDEIIHNLTKLNILDNNDVFRSFLHLISIIYQNHHQHQYNLKILENIISYYKKDILNNFQNCEIFTIFNNDNKLLLFLLKSEILKIDKFVIKTLKEDNYSSYFFPEVKDFLETSKKAEIEAKITDDFLEKRQIGENHTHICNLIRNDSIEQFITYISQTNLPYSYEIEKSIFETNSYLISNTPTMIEYAAFFGSIRIFQYLMEKSVRTTEKLWFYAIHGQNSEILQILEDSNNKPIKKTAEELYNESIQCHCNDIATYIYDNYINNQDNDNNNANDTINNENSNSLVSPQAYFKYYNFAFIETEQINYSNFIDFCKFDYTFFVDRLMKTITPDILNKNQIKNDEYDDYDIEYNEDALLVATYNNNNEVVKMLLSNDNIDVNNIYRLVAKVYLFDNLTIFYFVAFLVSLILPIFSSFLTRLPIFFALFLIDKINQELNYAGFRFSIRTLKNILSISKESIDILLGEITILNLACLNDNTEIANLLLSRQDIDVNARYSFPNIEKEEYVNGKEDTALTLALENDNAEIVKKLLSNPNIDVNIEQKSTVTRSMFQYSKFFLYISTILNRIILPLIIIATVTISFLLILIMVLISSRFRSYYEINKNGIINGMVMGIKIIIFIGDYSVVIYIIELISSFLYSTYEIKSPLCIALEKKNVENAKLLLSNKNINVNAEYKASICNQKDENCSIYSFDSYEEVHNNKTALNMAVEIGNAEIVDLLLSFENIDVNAKCKSTSYKKIVILNNLSISLYLLESIVCELFATRSRKSSLQIAVENLNVEIVKSLLKNNKIKNVKQEYKKFKQKQIKNDSSVKENDNEVEKKSNQIEELLNNFISENQLKQ